MHLWSTWVDLCRYCPVRESASENNHRTTHDALARELNKNQVLDLESTHANPSTMEPPMSKYFSALLVVVALGLGASHAQDPVPNYPATNCDTWPGCGFLDRKLRSPFFAAFYWGTKCLKNQLS